MSDIAAEPSRWAAFRQSITRLEKSKITSPWIALRNSLAVALPLGIGIDAGNPLGAVAITTGALNVSYSDGVDPYAQRARRMLTWSILGAIAVFIGSVTGKYNAAAILLSAAWAFAAGMLVSVSTKAGDLGLNTLVALIVFAARGAMSPKGAFYGALLVLAGGLLQTGFALLFWPVRRYQPQREAIGKVYLDLSREVEPHSDVLLSGPLNAPSAQVQDTLSALGRDHTVEGERYRLLLDQADRIRMSVFVLDRLRRELLHAQRKENRDADDGAASVDQLLHLTSKMLSAVGQSLLSGEPVKEQAKLLSEIHSLLQAMHSQQGQYANATPTEEAAPAADILAGQLRAVAELANHAIPEGLEAFARQEAAQPWRLQMGSWLGTLRANLDLHSATCRHAIRLAVCVALADAIGRGVFNWERSYWLPMTVAVVLKPDFTTTFSRGVLRLLGTFAGLVLATVLYHVLPQTGLVQLLLVGAFTFAMRLIGPANYGVFSVAISGLIVFLIAATGVPPGQVVWQRGLNTAAGGIFALIAYAVWPTWERTQVSEAMAEMLDACRAYFHAVITRFGRDDVTLQSDLDETRRAWRRARSNAEASVDRVSSEPRTTVENLNCLTSMLASSHALAHAIMGLEAGLIQAPVRKPPEAFEAFAIDAEFTLYFMAAALRGSAAAAGTMPRLREDHRHLVEARDALSPVDEFILIETDRITTALNTLREQVMRYVVLKN